MVSTTHLIFKSSSPCNNPLVTVLSTRITIDISVTLMFHSFFNSLARSRYLSLFSLFFSFIQWSAGMAKSIIRHVFFFCGLSLGLVVWSGLGDPFESLNPREMCASQYGLCVVNILFVRMVKPLTYDKRLAYFSGDHLSHPVMSYALFVQIGYIGLWFIVSSLSPHNLHLHLLFSCILSIVSIFIVIHTIFQPMRLSAFFKYFM